MKLWQRKKAWIKSTYKSKIETCLWHAFFPKTTLEMCYIAWNSKHQKDFEEENYHWYNHTFHWLGKTHE